MFSVVELKAEGETGTRCTLRERVWAASLFNGRTFSKTTAMSSVQRTALLISESGHQDIIAVFEDIQLASYDGGTYPNYEHVIYVGH